MFLLSCPEQRGVSLHLPTAPEHHFRESSQMAAHDSFARFRPIRFQERADPCRQGDDPLLAPRAVRASFAGNAEGALLPLDVVSGQVSELRDSESRIQQGPDDQLLLGAPAGVGEPISLFGPEGLTDELVCHLLTCLATRSVRSRTAIPNS